METKTCADISNGSTHIIIQDDHLNIHCHAKQVDEGSFRALYSPERAATLHMEHRNDTLIFDIEDAGFFMSEALVKSISDNYLALCQSRDYDRDGADQS